MNLDRILECKCCGNSVAAHFEIKDNGYVCKCCGAWNCPKNEPDPKNDLLTYRLSQGYEFLNNYDFERARNSFQRIIKDTPDSIDAYWGFLLAKFGVVYVKGFFNGIIEPVYCFPDYDSLGNARIRSTREFARILELIGDDKNLRELYNEHSLKIDRAILNFRKSIGNTEDDVFICVKISNATENDPGSMGHTEDSRHAERLEGDLKARGVRVFYSLHTLTKEIDSDDQIWTHLVKSKKMILIGSREDFLESVWVKSEWMRWLHLNRQNELYIYVLKHDDESPVSVLPYELRTKQIYTLDSYEKLLKDIVGAPDTAPEIAEDRDGKIILFNGREERIPYGTEEIGEDAYRDRSDIVRVIVPDGVKRICFGAFANCNKLLEAVLPESLLHIGDDAFYSCDALQKIYIPYRTETIGSQAFYGCGALEQITVPASVKKIGAGVFNYCDRLKGITVDKRNKNFYGSGHCIVDTKQETLIAGCMSTNIPRDDSVVRIGYNAFCGCSDLLSIDIPDSVQEIDDGAFMDCRNLKTVALTSSVARIGDEAFLNCPSLISVKYDAPRSVWDSLVIGRGNEAFKKAYEAGQTDPAASSELKAKLREAEKKLLEVQQQRAMLENDRTSARQKKEALAATAETNRKLETEYRNRASQAAREKEIAQRNQKNALDSKTKAARDMELSTQAEAAARAEEAAARARAEAAAREKAKAAAELKNADIRASNAGTEAELKARAESEAKAKAAAAEKEKNRSIAESNRLSGEISRIQMQLNTAEAAEKNILLEIEELLGRIDTEDTKDGKIVYDDGREDVLEYGMTEIERAAYSGNETVVRVILPASLTKIGARAFAGCSNLQSVKMPDTVETIEAFAFNKCTNLKEINLSARLTEIPNSMFQRCENLTKIVIPDGVTKIGSGAFNKCASLEDVTVPDTVKYVGTLAFAGCYVDESILPDGDIEIGNRAFDY